MNEQQMDEYLKLMEKLKFNLDVMQADIKEEFQTIYKSVEPKQKQNIISSFEIIKRLTIATEFKDEDTASHIKRISVFAVYIASKLNYNPDKLELLKYSSSLHDIGKIGVPDSILLKQGKLTAQEMMIAKTHTTLGYEILKDSGFPIINMSADIALNHHEKWSGKGYPRGLYKEEIPIEARIVMLCDQYDSLRSVRPYKIAVSHEDAYNILIHGDNRTSPDDFDPDILEIFKEFHEDFAKVYEKNK